MRFHLGKGGKFCQSYILLVFRNSEGLSCKACRSLPEISAYWEQFGSMLFPTKREGPWPPHLCWVPLWVGQYCMPAGFGPLLLTCDGLCHPLLGTSPAPAGQEMLWARRTQRPGKTPPLRSGLDGTCSPSSCNLGSYMSILSSLKSCRGTWTLSSTPLRLIFQIVISEGVPVMPVSRCWWSDAPSFWEHFPPAQLPWAAQTLGSTGAMSWAGPASST